MYRAKYSVRHFARYTVTLNVRLKGQGCVLLEYVTNNKRKLDS